MGAAAAMASISRSLRSRKMSTSDRHQVLSSLVPVEIILAVSSRRPGAQGGGVAPHGGWASAPALSVRQ